MRRILVGGFGVMLIFIAVNAHGLLHEASLLSATGAAGTMAHGGTPGAQGLSHLGLGQLQPPLPWHLATLFSLLPLELAAHAATMARETIWRCYQLLFAACASCLVVGFALTLLIQVPSLKALSISPAPESSLKLSIQGQ